MKISPQVRYTIILGAVIPALMLALFFSFRQTLWRISADFFHPFLSSISAADSVISDSGLELLSRRELVSKLNSAERHMAVLEGENSITKNLEHENAELREILGISAPRGFKCIYSEISVRDPLRWNETFTIDKGQEDGIRAGCIAIAFSVQSDSSFKFAVAGRVQSVSRHSALVESLVGPKNEIGAFITGKIVPGIIGGGGYENNRSYFRIKYLPGDLAYKEGEEIATSPYSLEIPPFLPVGKIISEEEWGPESEDLYKSAICSPYVDFRKIRFLIIMVKK